MTSGPAIGDLARVRVTVPQIIVPRVAVPRIVVPIVSMPRIVVPGVPVPRVRVNVPRVAVAVVPRVALPRVTAPRFRVATLIARMNQTMAVLAREDDRYRRMAARIAEDAARTGKLANRFLEISRRAYADFRVGIVDMLPPRDHSELVRLQRAELRRLERARLNLALLNSLTRPLTALQHVLTADPSNGPNVSVAIATGHYRLA
jgi:hypothetical protein